MLKSRALQEGFESWCTDIGIEVCLTADQVLFTVVVAEYR